MKKLFTALLLLVGFTAFSQSIGRFRYDTTILEKVGGNNEFVLLNSTRDSIGVLFNMGNGRTRFRTLTSLGVGSKVSNGIRMAGDTIQLGGVIHRATHLQLENHQSVGSGYSYLHLANRPDAETIIQEDTVHPTVSIYNPTTIAAEALYEESENDTAYLHYGGRFVSVVRNVFDSTSTRFAAANKYLLLPSNGFEGVYQFMIPRDSTVWRVGRDGQSANVIHAQWDLGNTYGYNTNVVPESGIPGFPLTTVLSSIDLMRNIDNTRRHKMTGAGVTGFMSRYKSYQSSINMSTYEAGNITDSVFGFKAYGDTYPLLSGATKEKTLAVWNVKNAFGFYAEPQYRYRNTVDNGYSFYAAGDSDIAVFKGFLYVGNNSPVRSANTEGLRYRIYNNGRYWGADSIHGFIVDGYSLSAQLPRSIGTQFGVNFSMKDSTQAATILMNHPDNRDSRYLAIRVEGFTAVNYPDNSPGMYIRFETGGNHANVSRINRNGNWTIGNSAAILAYRWWKKHAVDGGGVYRDTLRLEVAPLLAPDTSYKIVVRHPTTGDLQTMNWAYAGSGGGGGSGTVTDFIFTDANGFDGTVSTSTSTPTLSLNSTVADTRVMYSTSGALTGSGQFTFTGQALQLASTNTTQTTTSSALAQTYNSLTSGTGHYLASNSLADGKLLHLVVTGTAGLTNQAGLAISLSGANATGGQTTYGLDVSNTHTGTSTNVAARFTASGGSNNTSAIFTGRVAMGGVTSPFYDLDVGAGSIAAGSIVISTAAGSGTIGNFSTSSTNLLGTNTGSIYQYDGSTNSDGRVYIGGTGATQIGAGRPYSTLVMGAATVPEAGSGNHPFIGTAIFMPPSITSGAATVTDASTVRITGPTTATVSGTNSALLINAGNLRMDNGSISLNTAGNKLNIATGSNASIGTATLVSGTVTVNTTAVTANSIIFISVNTPSGTLGPTYTVPVGSITPGTSFVINAVGATGVVTTTDNSTVNWIIIN